MEVNAGPSGYSALVNVPGAPGAANTASLGLLYEVANHTEIVMLPTHIIFQHLTVPLP